MPENKIQLLTLFLFLALFFLTYLVPITDIDFWWHIASGRYIWETGSIPSVDPFLVFDNSNPVRNAAILKGYWLGQVTLYSVYHYFSDTGLIVFRALILVASLLLIYVRMRMCKLAGLSLWLPLLIAALVLQGFTGERPQLFSFVFIGLLMLLWEVFRTRKNKLWLLPVPFIFLLWSNVHGGFLLGVVVLSLLAGWDAIAAVKTRGWQRYWLGWGVFILIVLAASLINPGGIDTYLVLFQAQSSEAQSRTSEYISAFTIFQHGLWYQQLTGVLLLLFSLFAVVTAYKSRHWDRLSLIVFLGLISLTAYRYLVFFVIIAMPYIAQSLMIVERKFAGSITAGHKRSQWGALVAVSLALIAYVSLHQPAQSNDRFAELNEGLVQLKQRQSTGLAFNTMNIGGYLIWHLAPSVRTFIDGRLIDEKKLVPYTHILWATDYGKKWLDQYKFDWVIMSTKNQFTGERYTLVSYLAGHPQWRVLYQTEDWVIFEKIRTASGPIDRGKNTTGCLRSPCKVFVQVI